MDYHKDRFEDFSLMVFKKNQLLALLPANKMDNHVYSHQGLTYGGLLLPKNIKMSETIECFESILAFLNKENFKKLYLKLLPKIYHEIPGDEMEYLLFILKAKLVKCETLSTVFQNNKIPISASRLEGVKRGLKFKLNVVEVKEFHEFWNTILIKNLEAKHSVQPVHSLDEIQLLKSIFPDNIRQFNVYHDGKLVAGTTIFETKNVAHCQYIAGNEDKNTLGSLDFLHHHLIMNVFKNKKYYDFGSSNVNNGLNINQGLQFWKEGFGARTITHHFYRIKTANHYFLKRILQ